MGRFRGPFASPPFACRRPVPLSVPQLFRDALAPGNAARLEQHRIPAHADSADAVSLSITCLCDPS